MSDAISNFHDVGAFHQKFGLHSVSKSGAGQTDAENDAELMDFRVGFMQEELQEFILGFEEGDITQMADALVDLQYIVLGTAHLLGLPWHSLWDDVHRANMAKRRALPDGSDSKRGSAFDVVKPEGWQGPKTAEILRDNGFNV